MDLLTSKVLTKTKFQYYSGTTHHSEGHPEVKLAFQKNDTRNGDDEYTDY